MATARKSRPSVSKTPKPDSALDEAMMRRALVLARRGQGLVEPNPMVGCVIVKRGRVIGEGAHRRFGGPHAEVEALRTCTESPRGATAYVTLEPCRHFGKTPPCVDALIAARVARVVAALRDPNPLVNGGGAAALRRAGIRVDVGLCAEEASEVLAPFLTRVRQGRPFVIAKWAQDADGLLVTPPGRSKWISCPASRPWVHRLRARVDAILVGVGTVLADDPMLTARGVPVRRRAMRVVVDGRLRIPEKCRLVKTAGSFATVVFTSRRAAQSEKANRLRRSGVEVAACGSRGGRIILSELLGSPVLQEATNFLVEGGTTLLNAFFAAGLVDQAEVFIAPRRRADKGAGAPSSKVTGRQNVAVGIPLEERESGQRSTVASPLVGGAIRSTPGTSPDATPARFVRERRCGMDRHVTMRFAPH